MIIALIDNGSLEPAAHQNLRAVAGALATRTGQSIQAVSWKHSDRIPAASLGGEQAWTLKSFVQSMYALGHRDFTFIPFFISPQGAIGSALRNDLEKLQPELGDFRFRFTEGLAARGALAEILTDRIRAVLAQRGLRTPPVIVVDHGGPSPTSAELRNQIASEVRTALGNAVGPLAAASMEGEDYVHNQPLLADQLSADGFNRGPVVIAPLFLLPGRHAGPSGDLVQIARAAEDRTASPPLQCHFSDLIGTHPRVVEILAASLASALEPLPADTLA